MKCHQCHQQLSPAEVMKYEERSCEFEAFERQLSQGLPSGLEDVEIPDRVAPDVDRLTVLEDGTFVFPTAWLQPLCDRCVVLEWIKTVFYGWDGSQAYSLMWAYEDGTYGCPKSPVMAYSWALVVQQWSKADADGEDDPERLEADQLVARLTPRLTEAERDAALSLAEDVFTIARTYGAIWVPNPRPDYVAVFQRAFVR